MIKPGSPLFAASTGGAAIEPPWCGTPEPDFSADVLPDGTDPADTAGSFPHIPHYAIGCTLVDIQERSRGRMKIEVIGESSEGRAIYGVVINRLRKKIEQGRQPKLIHTVRGVGYVLKG